jgi:light-regulated signal transduction histidine kinase (bacteriophytochrome)
LTALHVTADAAIALAYYSIPIMLLYGALRSSVRHVPHLSTLGWFGAFILLCGTSHLIGIWTVWHPNYWVEGTVKAATAGVSLYTAVHLRSLMRPILDSIAIHQKVVEDLQRTQAHDAAHLQQRLTQVNEDLDGANGELTRFIYAACHDLAAPLRTIVNYLQRLERRMEAPLKEDPKAADYLFRAVAASSRLQELIKELGTFSTVSKEAEPLKAVALLSVVEAALENLGIYIRDTGAIVRYPKKMPTVIGSQAQLIQLFQNLIGNGIKYQPPSQTPLIEIDINEMTGAWHITVQDNGIGIDRQHYSQIFEMFRRLHSIDEYAGTGMGLAIVKRIVERHHGRVWVNSQPGQGSTFHFTIPA